MKATNIVLYAVREHEPRKPLASFAADDEFVAAKVAGEVGAESQRCKLSGASAPEFVVTRETREANEQGVIIAASFEMLDATCSKVKRKASTIDALFEKKAEKVAAAEQPETVASRKRSR